MNAHEKDALRLTLDECRTQEQAAEHGFKYLRDGGRHDIYSNGEKEVAIPRHREVNEITAKKIVRDMGG